MKALPFALLMALALNAHAVESLVVTTTADEDNGTSDPSVGTGTSLREAIKYALNDGVASVVTFDPRVFTLPRKSIVLTSTLPTLTDPQTLTITAPSAGVEISGNNQFRILIVNAGFGAVTLNGLTIRNGAAAGDSGGGINNQGRDLILDSCTLMNNTADTGGALYSNTHPTGATLFVRNCTFSGNSGAGAAIDMDGAASLESCTIVGNDSPAGNFSGAVYHDSSGTALPQVRNSIIAGNTGGGDVVAFYDTVDKQTYQSGGFNLIGQGRAADQFNAASDQRIGSDSPRIGPLAENGGRTPTRAPLIGSLAFFHGDSALSVDQRGLPRPATDDDCGAVKLAGSDPSGAAGLVVTTLQDSNSSVDGFISLREAIQHANTDGGISAITFDPTVFGGGRQTIPLNSALPSLDGDNALSITAPAAGVEISGNNARRVFLVSPGANITFTGLTIRNGSAGSEVGGGILNQGRLVLDSCTLRDNVANAGAGIHSQGDLVNRTVTLRNCTLSGNTATARGGAIYNNAGLVVLDSCTLAGNTAPTNFGSGIASFGDANTRTEVRSSIVSVNANTDVDFLDGSTNTFQSNGYNLIGDGNATGDFNQTGDVINNLDPGLAALADNGGKTQTRALLLTSPAREAGNTTLTVDQRGGPRPAPAGGQDDVGAYEANTYAESLVVTTTVDEDNGTSDPRFGAGTSLREAINYANSLAGNSAITFSGTAFVAPRKTITLGGTQLPAMTGTLSITGPAAGVEISGNNASRVFDVSAGANVTLSGLTVRNGQAPASSSGGGLRNVGGAVLLDQCTFTSNTSPGTGGAVFSNTDLSGVTITVRNCTFTSNISNSDGGAIYNFDGLMIVDSCTITGNTSGGSGAGIASRGNTSDTRTEVRNSIISTNNATDVSFVGGNGTNSFQSNGSNLIGDGNAAPAFNQVNDVTGNTDPGLNALADNGGKTQTRAVQPQSPARDLGSTNLTVDQRGAARPQNGADDKGAFELVINESLVVTTTTDEDDNTSDPTFGTGTSLREAINYANHLSANAAITFNATAFAAPRKTILLSQALAANNPLGFALSITAPQAGVEINGNNNTAAFINSSNTTLTGLTIRNGNSTTNGGAIRNFASLLLDSCSFYNNTAAAGGAIFSQGHLDGQLALTMRNCTFTGNSATTAGGALHNLRSRAVIESCTLTGNNAPADSGSGVASLASADTFTEVHNSIIAGNNNGDVDFYGTGVGNVNSFQSDGSNLIGDGNATAKFNQTGDQLIGNAAPGLKPLANNGGRTLTLALLPESLAVNAGNTSLAFDQRGIIRPQGAADDIGAFELVILAINPTVLANGLVGQVYPTANLIASGGTSPYTFSLVAGHLPPGLTLTSAGQISGTARSAGVYPFTVRVDDSAAGAGARDYIITVAGVSAPLAEAATVWYRAEGNSNSFAGPAANIVGNVTFAAGQTGQAFAFAGDGGYVALSPSVFPYPTAGTSAVPFSFETWFATTGSGVILGQQNVAPFNNTGGAVPAIYVGLDGKLRVEFFWNGSITQLTTAGVVNDGAFHHIAAVYNGSTVAAYFDGVSIGSHAFTETAYTGPYFYQLGTGLSASRASTPGGWFNFTGLIDEAAIYARALSAAEVQSLFAAGQKGKSTEPFFTSIDRNGTSLTIGLGGWPNLHFQLQHSPTLSPANYSNIGAPAFTDGNGDASFSITPPVPGAATGFFRAVEVP